jgi:polyribonucleotide nucleotidyltransferase
MIDEVESFVKKTDIGGRELEVKINYLAPQSDASVLLTYGQTTVLVTCVMAKEKREGVDFLPLVVDYEEKLYAAGKISSSRFIKREGKPSDEAILTARLIDRAIRPLFPKNLYNDIQIIATVLSVDGENDPDIAAMMASSLAISCSPIPFNGPLGTVRVGRINGEWVLNPTYNAREKSDLDLIIAGIWSEENQDIQVVMIEAGAKEIQEEDFLAAIEYAKKHILKNIKFQEEIIKKCGKEKIVLEEEPEDIEIKEFVEKNFASRVADILDKDKLVFQEKFNATKKEIEEKITLEFNGKRENLDETCKKALNYFNGVIKKFIRENILKKKKRHDGRGLEDIREIKVNAGILGRTHGSGYFKRGYTEVLTIATLGSSSAEQILDGVEPVSKKRFMHHYNFPPFSTGEVGKMFVSRREIGHGALAERALEPLIPEKEEFPYTIRLVSEVLSSDGSTSMASVCGSTLALMDAGVPIKRPAAGISIGLVKEEKEWTTMVDICGIEDFNGDMDFKVAGTEQGITAVQMDLKISGISLEIIKDALLKAKKARLIILEKIKKVLAAPRPHISPFAPHILLVKISPEKIRDIIGPSGKTIQKIIGETQSEIDIEEDGKVYITAPSADLAEKAKNLITSIAREYKVGDILEVEVKKVVDFGAFVEAGPGVVGLIHISELAPYHVKSVTDVVKPGDKILAKIINIDEQGRLSFSLKQVFEQEKQEKGQ